MKPDLFQKAQDARRRQISADPAEIASRVDRRQIQHHRLAAEALDRLEHTGVLLLERFERRFADMRRLRVVRDRFPVEIAVVPAEFKHRVIIVPDARAALLKHFLALGHGTAEGGKVVHLHTAVLREQPRGRLLRKDITAARVVQHDAPWRPNRPIYKP